MCRPAQEESSSVTDEKVEEVIMCRKGGLYVPSGTKRKIIRHKIIAAKIIRNQL